MEGAEPKVGLSVLGDFRVLAVHPKTGTPIWSHLVARVRAGARNGRKPWQSSGYCAGYRPRGYQFAGHARAYISLRTRPPPVLAGHHLSNPEHLAGFGHPAVRLLCVPCCVPGRCVSRTTSGLAYPWMAQSGVSAAVTRRLFQVAGALPTTVPRTYENRSLSSNPHIAPPPRGTVSPCNVPRARGVGLTPYLSPWPVQQRPARAWCGGRLLPLLGGSYQPPARAGGARVHPGCAADHWQRPAPVREYIDALPQPMRFLTVPRARAYI